MVLHCGAASDPPEILDGDIRSIHTLDGVQNNYIDDRRHDIAFWKSWTPEGHAKIECSKDISLVGHSFGGATMVGYVTLPLLETYPRHIRSYSSSLILHQNFLT